MLNTDRFFFGDSEISFNGPDFKIKGELFKGTPGLYELIFKNKPLQNEYNLNDLRAFGYIVKLTNANRPKFNANKAPVGNKGFKFMQVIKPALEIISNEENAQQQQRYRDLRLGGKLNNVYSTNPIQYVYFDDPNELVDRLKLLIASSASGNNAHINEINSIIEELRERNLIE